MPSPALTFTTRKDVICSDLVNIKLSILRQIPDKFAALDKYWCFISISAIGFPCKSVDTDYKPHGCSSEEIWLLVICWRKNKSTNAFSLSYHQIMLMGMTVFYSVSIHQTSCASLIQKTSKENFPNVSQDLIVSAHKIDFSGSVQIFINYRC